MKDKPKVVLNKQTDPAPLTNDPMPQIKPVEVQITDIDREKFFKAFISDQPFCEEYSLFEKKVTVKFKTLTVSENNDVFRQISLDNVAGIAKNEQSYMVVITLYRLAQSLQEINGEKFSDTTKETFIEQENLTYVKAKADTLLNWPAFKLTAFLEAYRMFEEKVERLTAAVQEPSFWKAAG